LSSLVGRACQPSAEAVGLALLCRRPARLATLRALEAPWQKHLRYMRVCRTSPVAETNPLQILRHLGQPIAGGELPISSVKNRPMLLHVGAVCSTIWVWEFCESDERAISGGNDGLDKILIGKTHALKALSSRSLTPSSTAIWRIYTRSRRWPCTLSTLSASRHWRFDTSPPIRYHSSLARTVSSALAT